MVEDKAERSMGTKDRVFWKPIGKYGDIMNNHKEKKQKRTTTKKNCRKTKPQEKRDNEDTEDTSQAVTSYSVSLCPEEELSEKTKSFSISI